MNFSSENGVLFNKDMTRIICYPRNKSGSYIIPESVEIIGTYSFDNCSQLSSLTIPNSVTIIEEGAFDSCIALTSIIIPGSVTEIGNEAFAYCQGLIEIFNYSTVPQEITPDVFLGIDFFNCVLRVPDVTAYKNTAVWKEFKNIEALEAEMTLNYHEIFLLTGRSSILTATVNGDVLSPNDIVWNSSHSGVATVDETGKVTALISGSTVITASTFGNDATCAATVIEPGKSSIEGTVINDRKDNVIVNLYMKSSENGTTKGKVIGGYVLLASTIPNDDGWYGFDDLPEGLYQVELVIDDCEPEATKEISLLEDVAITDINFIVDQGSGIIIIDIPNPTVAKEFSVGSNLKVYPNPFAGALHIEGAEGSTLRIFAVDGKPAYIQTVNSDNETIHLERLPAGMYIIRLENGGRGKTVRVIKN